MKKSKNYTFAEMRKQRFETKNAEIEQEVNRAKEALRSQVSAIAIAGAEKILEGSIDEAANEEMLNKLATEL